MGQVMQVHIKHVAWIVWIAGAFVNLGEMQGKDAVFGIESPLGEGAKCVLAGRLV